MDIPAFTSRIDSVTVYRQGALVSRSARIPAGQPAPARIKLVNLPLGLDDGSVRVRVEDAGASPPVASDVRVVLDLPVVEEDLPPPDDAALEQARRDVQDIAERIIHLEARRRRLERLQLVNRPDGKRGEPPPPSPVEARMALMDFRYRSMAVIDDELAAARVQAREAARVREALEQRHRAASTARQPRAHELRKAAVVSLRGHDRHGDLAASPRIVVEYMVPGARWAPSYAIHLSQDMSQATVSVRAVVAQRTGEDWSDVQLTLATADAQGWFDLPEMQALRIGRRQAPVPRRGWRAPPAGSAELYADYDRFVAITPPGKAKPPVPARPAAPARAEAERAREQEPFEDEHTPTWDGMQALARASMKEAVDADEAFEEASGVTRDKRVSAPARKSRARSAGPPPAPAPMMAAASMPPPPQAAPAPMADMSRMMSAGPPGMPPAAGGFVGSFGRGGGGDEGGGSPPHELALPEEAHELAPEQLAYGDLRMPGPDDGRRGKLVVARRQERYLELLWVREQTRQEELQIDVVGLVDSAVRQAQGVRNQPLPARHHPAASWDGFDYTYAADSTVDIPSDGAFHSVPLMGRPARATLDYVVVPRESTDVFRRLALHNPLDAPLMPGPADVYVGGDYLLTANLRATAQRGKVELGLGVEQSIKVSRNTRFAEESAGLMGGSLALRHELIIEVANRRDRSVRVEVQERLPITRDKEDEIQLDVGQVEPPWSAFEPPDYELRGGYRWQVEVPPGQQTTLRAAYTIKISAKKELSGGNRRES